MAKTAKPEEVNVRKSSVKILPCRCAYPYQDTKYGVGNRLHNAAKGPNSTTIWRCTVCKSEK